MRVIELWRFPVKSVGGEQLTAADVGPLGIEGDRGWGLVDDATGNVLTGRREPRLLMASASIIDGAPVVTPADGGALRTSAEMSRWLGRPVTLAADSERSRVSIVSTDSLGGWDVRRFRTNVVVDGSGEDGLVGGTVRLGGVCRSGPPWPSAAASGSATR